MDTPNPSPANSSSCISGSFQREAPLSKCLCTSAAREAGVSASTARFHAEAKGNTGGLTLSRVHVVPLTNQRNHIGPAPMKTCSAAAPVLQTEYTVFNTAIGRIDAPAAATAVAPTASGRASHTRHVGANATIQGSSSGRLLALAPVSSAADNTERQTSDTRPDFRARRAKSTAAKAYTVPNMSLEMLPACNKKQYPVGSSHIQCHATRGFTPTRRRRLTTSPGSSRNDAALIRNSKRSVRVKAINGAER